MSSEKGLLYYLQKPLSFQDFQIFHYSFRLYVLPVSLQGPSVCEENWEGGKWQELKGRPVTPRSGRSQMGPCKCQPCSSGCHALFLWMPVRALSDHGFRFLPWCLGRIDRPFFLDAMTININTTSATITAIISTTSTTVITSSSSQHWHQPCHHYPYPHQHNPCARRFICLILTIPTRAVLFLSLVYTTGNRAQRS